MGYLISFVVVTVLLVRTPWVVAAEPTLKETFADDFKVGVALSTAQAMGEEPAAMALVERQFNAISPENLLKWESVHPEPARYNFEPVDKFVEYGEKHRMFVVGHTLVWHNQTPAWVFEDGNGKPLGRESLLERMREHIHAVVGRYKGRIKGWDVVNEAVLPDGDYRKTKWFRIVGPDYIEKAYQYAHEADPDAELYYNDYNEWKLGARAGIARMIRNLKAKGVKIDGLGLQGHWGMDYPTLEELDETFNDYGQLGVKLMVTELDIDVLPLPDPDERGEMPRFFKYEEWLDPFAGGFPEDQQKALAERYVAIFRVLMRHRDKIDRVTFWGVHDGQSWRNYFPIERMNYPLLFDRELRPKPAFVAVVETARTE